MGTILSLVTGGLSTVISGLVAPLLGYFTSRDTMNEKGFEIGATTDAQVQVAYIQAQVQTAQLQASQNTWWGARMVMVTIAGLMTIHLAAVVFDSMPMSGHVVGSWQIAALPGPIAAWEGQIILSFFILAPVAPAISALASWLHRK